MIFGLLMVLVEATQAVAEGKKKPSKEDSFNQLQIHQGVSFGI